MLTQQTNVNCTYIYYHYGLLDLYCVSHSKEDSTVEVYFTDPEDANKFADYQNAFDLPGCATVSKGFYFKHPTEFDVIYKFDNDCTHDDRMRAMIPHLKTGAQSICEAVIEYCKEHKADISSGTVTLMRLAIDEAIDNSNNYWNSQIKKDEENRKTQYDRLTKIKRDIWEACW